MDLLGPVLQNGVSQVCDHVCGAISDSGFNRIEMKRGEGHRGPCIQSNGG